MRLFCCIIAIIFIHCLPSETASSSFQIRSISKYNWDVFGKNEINKGCKYDINGKCTGTCRLTSKKCVELVNFNKKVCGCEYCKFDASTRRCSGQCGNLILSKCVSKPAIPSRDEDCICSSCKSKWITSNKIVLPSCDGSTCNNNACEPVYVSVDGRVRVNNTLYCNCLNFRF
jgi:hypothetical protein